MVAIKDVEMPKNCAECFNYGCEFKSGAANRVIYKGETRRHSGCPLVDIEERKEGKWEYRQLGFRAYGIVCTNCGYVIHQGYDFTSMKEFKDMVERELQNPHITMDKYCCKCGAEMVGVENGTTNN